MRDEVLEQHRDAAERAVRQLTAGGVIRLVEQRCDEHTELRVERLQTRDCCVDEFLWLDLPADDMVGLGGRVEVGVGVRRHAADPTTSAVSPTGLGLG